MKKILYLIVLVLLLTGCKSNQIVCKIDLENKTENYKKNSVYKITYNNKYATKVDKVDIYTSDDKEEIDYLEEVNKLKLSNNKVRYKGYTYKIKKDKNKLEINTTVDIESLNKNKIILDNIIDRNYVKGNKIVTNGLIEYYESIGAKCTEG